MTAHVPLYLKNCWSGCSSPEPETGAAAPAVPIKDTIKRAKDGIIQETVDRSALFAVQTPQVFQADFISAALYDCIQKGVAITDDCSAAEHLRASR